MRPVHRRLSPAGVDDDDQRSGQRPRLPVPAALARLHGVQGVLADLSRLRVPGLQVRHARWRSRSPSDRPPAARGVRGDRRGDGRRRMPILRRVPDDAVHRGARAHGQEAAARRRCVHERRERAGGDRHGLGGGEHRRPGGDRLDRAGPVADAGVARRDVDGAPAAGRAQHGPRPGRLPPGHARRRARRLPAGGARPRRRARSGASWCSSPSTSPTRGAIRCSSSATTTSPTRPSRSTSSPLDFGPCPPTDWALDGSSGGSGAAEAGLAARRHQAPRRRRLRPRRATTHGVRRAIWPRWQRHVEPHGRDRSTSTTPRSWSSPSAPRQAPLCACRAPSCARRAIGSASSARSRSCPFPTDVGRRRCRPGPAPWPSTRTIGADGRRRPSRRARRCPVHFIGGLSLDSSGFGIAPDFDVAVLRRADRRTCCDGRTGARA